MNNVIPKKARVIPFGYKVSSENPDYLEEIPLEIEALEKARKYIKDGYSYRATREWLISATNRQLSIAGFWKLINVGKSSTASREEKEAERQTDQSTGNSSEEGKISPKTG